MSSGLQRLGNSLSEAPANWAEPGRVCDACRPTRRRARGARWRAAAGEGLPCIAAGQPVLAGWRQGRRALASQTLPCAAVACPHPPDVAFAQLQSPCVAMPLWVALLTAAPDAAVIAPQEARSRVRLPHTHGDARRPQGAGGSQGQGQEGALPRSHAAAQGPEAPQARWLSGACDSAWLLAAGATDRHLAAPAMFRGPRQLAQGVALCLA